MKFKLYDSSGGNKYYRGSDGRLYSEEQKKVMEDKSLIEPPTLEMVETKSHLREVYRGEEKAEEPKEEKLKRKRRSRKKKKDKS